MPPPRPWDRPEEYDHACVVVDDERAHLRAIVERLRASSGREREHRIGTYPRFKVLPAKDADQALGQITADVSVVAVDLVLPKRSGPELIRDLRDQRSDLAILAYSSSAPATDAVAAIAAGADHFHEYRDLDSFAHAIEVALERRKLTRSIDRHEAEMKVARARLAESFAPALPGFKPPFSADAVLPFAEAAKRYLTAAAHVFEGDGRGLAQRLGVSYFALRRLLKRYGVPLPGRSPSTTRKRRS